MTLSFRKEETSKEISLALGVTFNQKHLSVAIVKGKLYKNLLEAKKNFDILPGMMGQNWGSGVWQGKGPLLTALSWIICSWTPSSCFNFLIQCCQHKREQQKGQARTPCAKRNAKSKYMGTSKLICTL